MTPNVKEAYKNLCINHNMDGLRQGLSHFSQPSRVALIFAFSADDELRICDPQNLLRGHEPKLKEIFLAPGFLGSSSRASGNQGWYNHIDMEKLDLSGLIAYGGRSEAVSYQMWFTEHHPDMCSIGPTQMWLEHAVSLMVQDIILGNEINIGTSGYVLQGYAVHAVRDYIVDRRNILIGPDSGLHLYPILDSILAISSTREEGAWARGRIAFVEGGMIPEMHLSVEFPEMGRPSISKHKHVRKLLLAVENSPRQLISDGRHIVGISDSALPVSTILASFRGNHGYLYLDDECVCSIADGNFNSTTRRAKLVQLEEALLEADLEKVQSYTLFNTITAIVHNAQEQKWGCTLVIDLNETPLDIAGQKLSAPLSLTVPKVLDLAKSLTKMDGALHIGKDLRLHRFGCLLDGRCVSGEDSSRGARYNSALRFTAENEGMIVIVVSADRPVSVVQNGVELSAVCEWQPVPQTLTPPTLTEWIERA